MHLSAFEVSFPLTIGVNNHGMRIGCKSISNVSQDESFASSVLGAPYIGQTSPLSQS